MKEIFFYIACASFLIFALLTYLYIVTRNDGRNVLQYVISKARLGGISFREMEKKIQQTTLYEKRMHYLEEMIHLTHDSERTPESIMDYQKTAAIFGIISIFLIMVLLKNVLFTVLGVLLFGYILFLPDINLKQNVTKIREDFDKTLIDFLNQVYLAMHSGLNLNRAMDLASETIEGVSKIEFKQLMLDIQRNPQNISIAFNNLAQRIPTKNCERFSMFVVTGLNNGNPISSIIAEETERLAKEQLLSIQESGEKNQIKSTAISTAFIFMPMLIIFIAPLVATSI